MFFIKKKLRSRLLLKYTVSYLLVFLIPFMLMSYFLYNSSIVDLRHTIEDSNLNKLKRAESYTSERMQELSQLATRITDDFRLTPYKLSNDFYSKNAIKELKSYKENSLIIEDVFLYFHNDDNVYSSSGSYSIATLLDYVPPFTQMPRQVFLNKLQVETPEINLQGIETDNKDAAEENMMVSLNPIPVNNPNPYGTVMFTIKESVLTKQINNLLGDFQGNTYILDQNDDVVAASENDDAIDTSMLQDVKKNTTGNNQMSYSGNDYSISIVQSKFNSWTFISLMNTNQINNILLNKKLLFVILLVALLLLGVVIAVLFGNKQYTPIRKLYEKTRDQGDENGREIKEYDELDTINNAIADIFESHENLSNRVLLQKPFARDQMLVNLLNGNLNNRDDLDVLLTALNIDMKAGSYFVALLYFESLNGSEEDMKRREDAVQYLSDGKIDNVAIQAVDLLYNDVIALIISTDDNLSHITQTRRQIIYNIQQQVDNMAQSKPIIGVGRPCEDKRNINGSYIEALATIDHRFAVQQGSILYFEDLGTQTGEKIGYPQENQLKLIHSLKQGDSIVSQQVLKEMFVDISSGSRNGHQIKAICFDIINTVMKTAAALDISKYVGDIAELVDFESIQQLEQKLQHTVALICEKVETKTEHSNELLSTNITNYIHSYYKTYDMSLESMARYFQLSVPYLSRFIKEQLGITFTHYVFELRLEDVKQELQNSNKLIKEIIVNVGYTDVSNFSREFKKAEGVTPGQYRKLNRK